MSFVRRLRRLRKKHTSATGRTPSDPSTPQSSTSLSRLREIPVDDRNPHPPTVAAGPSDLRTTPHARPEKAKSKREELLEELFPGRELYGIRVLHEPEAPIVDIVFVHGLTGNSFKTWLERDTLVHWPVHLLPKDVANARIMTFGYDADVTGFLRPVGRSGLSDHAWALLENLSGHRAEDKTDSRKIIFIVHSLGGLVTKKALCLSAMQQEPCLKQLHEHTLAIAFLGTPHRGSSLAPSASRLSEIINSVGLNSTTKILKVLQKGSEVADNLNTEFARWAQQRKPSPEIMCFWEEKEMTLVGIVVTQDSATFEWWPQLSIPADHKSMTKFSASQAEGYVRIRRKIKEWLLLIDKPTIFEKSAASLDVPLMIPRTLTSDEEACLDSLSFPEMGRRRFNVDVAAHHTCGWLLKHRSYQTWLNRSENILWIEGNPGSGKSTLMRFALDKISEMPDPGELDTVCNVSFFFHGRGAPIEKCPEGLYRALLHQLLEEHPSHFSALVQFFKSKRFTNGFAWTTAELRSFLQAGLHSLLSHCSIRIFVDALDECGSEMAEGLVDDFNELIAQCTGKKVLSICFSCRHYPVIFPQNCVRICTQEENKEDIEDFIHQKIQLTVGKDIGVLDDLIADIKLQSRGNFQWVGLVVPRIIRSFRHGHSVAKLKSIISQIPPELNDLYRKIFEEMVGEDGPRSLQLFQWIYFAQRPLSLEELRWAMNVGPNPNFTSFSLVREQPQFIGDDEVMERQVIHLSRGLVEVTLDEVTVDELSLDEEQRDRRVQFIHQSVNDFLLSTSSNETLEGGFSILDNSAGPQSTCMFVGGTHVMLHRTCVIYFTMAEMKAVCTRDSALELPFLLYAIRNWLEHARLAENEGMLRGDLLQTVQRPHTETIDEWVRLLSVTGEVAHGLDFPSRSTILHAAAGYNLASVIALVLDADEATHKCDINERNSWGISPLVLASKHGSEAVVSKLLARPDIDVNAVDPSGESALIYAAQYGHADVVSCLLARPGVEVNVVDIFGRSALIHAASGGYKDVINCLLARCNVEVNAVDNDGWSALIHAAWDGHEDVVSCLLARPSVEVNVVGNDGRTALMYAALYGHEDVVKCLLARSDVEVNVVDNDGWSALIHAASEGYEDVVNCLLARSDVEVHMTDHKGRSALAHAAEHGRTRVVRQLEEYARNNPPPVSADDHTLM